MLTREQIQLKKEKLARQLPQAIQRLSSCTLCPRNCRVDRTSNEAGYCQTLDRAVVYGYMVFCNRYNCLFI